jgi:VanZ family protein
MSAYRGEARTARRARAAAGNVGDQIGTSADLSGKFYRGGLARDDIDQYYASHRVASSRRCRISHTRATKFRPYTGVEHHLEHFLAFLLLGLIFGFGYPGHRRVVALIGIIMAAILETLQLWVPGRHASFADFAVNATGAWVGLAAAAAFQWIKRPRAS